MFRKHPATTAMPNPAHGIGERRGQGIRSVPVSFKQMKSDSLRRLLSDAGHTPQTIDQANKKW
jgi:hypothetical protein